MQKENNVLKAMVKLAMCSGDRASCRYKSICSYNHCGATCAENLRADYEFVLDAIDACLSDMMAGTRHATPVKRTLEQRVTEVIHSLGIPASLVGYKYTRAAIILSVKNANAIDQITSILYPTIAKQFDTTPSRVERAIRHAIEVMWDRGDTEVLTSYFGYTVSGLKGKPTNSEFIALIADNIRLELANDSTV